MAALNRLLLTGAAFAVAMPMPALSQENRAGEIARQLDDPLTQYMVAGAIAAMSKNLLEMNIEPIVRAVETVGGGSTVDDLPRDARLGDLIGPEAEDVPGEVMHRVPRMMGVAAGMAAAVEEMLPELEAMTERMKATLPRY